MERYPDGARLEKGLGGLDRLVLHATEGEALVYLQGAHVAHFEPKGGRPVLWMSAASRFEAGKPLRGGVPVCFPWFGPKAGSPEAPLHGFARILPWAVGAVVRETDGGLRAVLELTAEAAARGGFPRELSLSLVLTVSRTLRMELTVRNVDSAPATYEEALHSYFAVSDVRQARIRGLEGVAYVDKTAAMARRPGESGPIAIAAETDRVYPGATGTVTIEDPGWRRRIVVGKSGSATTVVWNPWVAKAKAMPDFGDEEWTGMVCVETANAMDDAVTLAPGASHVMTATLEVRAV
ncbi:MAG TPA: D-hexose-6-phosphate mutarotase [Vicinamibacteria bacterium]|nr:D-hexose-6-phosphate mutarotase [Vicinamibacteria bacterium]